MTETPQTPATPATPGTTGTQPEAAERTALVELTDVSKYYGNVRALEGVSSKSTPGRSPVSSATTARASRR